MLSGSTCTIPELRFKPLGLFWNVGSSVSVWRLRTLIVTSTSSSLIVKLSLESWLPYLSYSTRFVVKVCVEISGVSISYSTQTRLMRSISFCGPEIVTSLTESDGSLTT